MRNRIIRGLFWAVLLALSCWLAYGLTVGNYFGGADTMGEVVVGLIGIAVVAAFTIFAIGRLANVIAPLPSSRECDHKPRRVQKSAADDC